MAKDDVIEVDGVVVDALPNANFKVKLELSTYDLTKGRITWRGK